jgi:hypothetical protein
MWFGGGCQHFDRGELINWSTGALHSPERSRPRRGGRQKDRSHSFDRGEGLTSKSSVLHSEISRIIQIRPGRSTVQSAPERGEGLTSKSSVLHRHLLTMIANWCVCGFKVVYGWCGGPSRQFSVYIIWKSSNGKRPTIQPWSCVAIKHMRGGMFEFQTYNKFGCQTWDHKQINK